MDGENNGKPYSNGWFGGKTHYSWKHPYDDHPIIPYPWHSLQHPLILAPWARHRISDMMIWWLHPCVQLRGHFFVDGFFALSISHVFQGTFIPGGRAAMSMRIGEIEGSGGFLAPCAMCLLQWLGGDAWEWITLPEWKILHFDGIYQERWTFSWAMVVSGRVFHLKSLIQGRRFRDFTSNRSGSWIVNTSDSARQNLWLVKWWKSWVTSWRLQNKHIHPGKLTAGTWKSPVGKGKVIFQTSIFWVPC